MKNIHASVFLLAAWLFFGFGPVVNATPMTGNFNGEIWTIEICNNCYSSSDFEYAASFMLFGKIAVFNLDSGEVRSFQVNMGTTFPNADLVPINSPPEAIDAIIKYFELVDTLELLSDPEYFASQQNGFVTSLSIPEGNFGGICGPEGHVIATWIPDGIFGPACGVHDQCYGEGEHSKVFCDSLFYEAMKDAINKKLDSQGFFLRQFARIALHDAANKYYAAVKYMPMAYNAYCGEANENTEYCKAGYARAQLGYEFRGQQGGSFNGELHYQGKSFNVVYEYTCYPTRVAVGEYVWYNEYCEYRLVSDYSSW